MTGDDSRLSLAIRRIAELEKERNEMAFLVGQEVAENVRLANIVKGIAAKDPIRHQSGGCCGESEWSCIGCDATADMGAWDRLGVDFLGIEARPRPTTGYNEEAIRASFPHADSCLWKLACAAVAGAKK
jgi:hypothetical protein